MRPIPDLKAQGGEHVVHWGEPQPMAAELGSYKQAHTSSVHLTVGNSRVKETPASLKELGSRAQTSVEVSPTISSRYRSASRTSSGSFPPQQGDIPCSYGQCHLPEIGSSGPPPTTTIQIAQHRPLLNPPAGDEPT